MRWTEMSGVERLPIPPNALLPGRLRRVIRETPHDLLVCTSFFDRWLSIPALVLRRLGLIPRKPMLLAPRGEFNPGALAIRSGRKRSYIRLVETLNLLRGVHVQATDPIEATAIANALPSARSIIIGPNLRGLPELPPHQPRLRGDPLRVAFVGRISPIKNLDVALKLLASAGIAVQFDIIGPVSDNAYWRDCQALIPSLPPPVEVNVRGAIPPADVVARLAGYDLLLLPTGGENYGHAIVDSLVAGTPVMISDQTPWRDLAAQKAGVDLPLAKPDLWLEWLRRFSAMDASEMAEWRVGARDYGDRSTGSAEAAAEMEACLILAMNRA